jgi:hypothetical protein
MIPFFLFKYSNKDSKNILKSSRGTQLPKKDLFNKKSQVTDSDKKCSQTKITLNLEIDSKKSIKSNPIRLPEAKKFPEINKTFTLLKETEIESEEEDSNKAIYSKNYSLKNKKKRDDKERK